MATGLGTMGTLTSLPLAGDIYSDQPYGVADPFDVDSALDRPAAELTGRPSLDGTPVKGGHGFDVRTEPSDGGGGSPVFSSPGSSPGNRRRAVGESSAILLLPPVHPY